MAFIHFFHSAFPVRNFSFVDKLQQQLSKFAMICCCCCVSKEIKKINNFRAIVNLQKKKSLKKSFTFCGIAKNVNLKVLHQNIFKQFCYKPRLSLSSNADVGSDGGWEKNRGNCFLMALRRSVRV